MADRPVLGHGDTALKPMAEPKVRRTKEMAAAQSPPGIMAPQGQMMAGQMRLREPSRAQAGLGGDGHRLSAGRRKTGSP